MSSGAHDSTKSKGQKAPPHGMGEGDTPEEIRGDTTAPEDQVMDEPHWVHEGDSDNNGEGLSLDGDLGSKLFSSFMEDMLDLPDASAEEDPNPFILQGLAYFLKYQQFDTPRDLIIGIVFYKQAVVLTPDDHEKKPFMLFRLGAAIQLRYTLLGERSDLDEAFEFLSLANALTPSDVPEKLEILDSLGNLYLSRFECLGKLEDVNESISCLERAIELSSERSIRMSTYLNSLGRSYLRRFEYLSETEDINKSIECLIQASLLNTTGDTGKVSILTNLGSALQRRFHHLEQVQDIQNAIDYLVQATSLATDSSDNQCFRLGILGSLYHSRFTRLADPEDIENAIEYLSETVPLIPDRHIDKPSMLDKLGRAYLSRAKHLDMEEDVNRAIEYLTQAATLTPNDHATNHIRIGNLGAPYLYRFDLLGDLSDINKAIECQIQALSLAPKDSSALSHLDQLGISYSIRFEHLRQTSDIHKALDCAIQVNLLTPHDHEAKRSRLFRIGHFRLNRFHHLSEFEDVTKAIHYMERAVSITPDNHPFKQAALEGLGFAHLARMKYLNVFVDTEKAIACFTQSIALSIDGPREKARKMTNLGTTYWHRFDYLVDVKDIDKAIELQFQAVALTRREDPQWPDRIARLGLSYQSRFEHLVTFRDLESAIGCFKEAAQSNTGSPVVRFEAARQWARMSSLFDIPSALQAYDDAMSLLPHVVWVGATINQRYDHLMAFGVLPTEAASCAIELGAYDRALEWLEQGRSIVWSQLLQLRTPFDDLAIANPTLARKLKEVARKLEKSEDARSQLPSALVSLDDLPDLEQHISQHQNLASEWEQLLDEARCVPGFEYLIRPRKASELMSAANGRTIVLINTYEIYCDALILLPGTSEITHISLPNFSSAKAIEARQELGQLIGHRGFTKVSKKNSCTLGAEIPLKHSLGILWQDLVKPVLDFLGYTDKLPHHELPHITWCTTGALSFLPLHAAGCYDGSHLNAFDLTVSSYTPTIGALLVNPSKLSESNLGILAVGQENTPGQLHLPYTRFELAAIEEHMKSDRYLQLAGDQATVDAVLDGMGRYGSIHLACHATQNCENPVQSAFHLHDGSLTLSEISKRSFKDKRLAFLSACQTATGDQHLPDEAVHLAAGILMAGYPSVIATMWSICDVDGPEVAEQVYAEFSTNEATKCVELARALHKAVAGLREKVGVNAVERWAPFIHLGL